MTRFLTLAATLVLTACAHQSAPEMSGKPAMPPDILSESECTAAGGSWGRVGLMGTLACTQPSPTAGKECTDSEQCAGMCWSNGPAGSQGKGMCQPTNMPFGCHSEMKGGVVQPALCAD